MKIMNVLGLSLVPLALGQVSNPSGQECSVDNLCALLFAVSLAPSALCPLPSASAP